MHGRIATDAVPGPVIVVEAVLPEGAAGEGVEVAAARALGETCRGDGDMCLEDECKALAHFVGRLADSDSAGDVGRPVTYCPPLSIKNSSPARSLRLVASLTR